MPEQWHQRMAHRRAEHLARLKAALAITPEQESAWSQFEAAMQPPAKPQPSGERGDWAKLTTPERIDRMEQRMADRQQRVKQMGDAVKALYAQLTPQQQKTLDQHAMHFAEEHAKHGRFGWHGKHDDGAAPHMRHHPLAKPAAAASQAD
jgi:fructosamine-3-kinase